MQNLINKVISSLKHKFPKKNERADTLIWFRWITTGYGCEAARDRNIDTNLEIAVGWKLVTTFGNKFTLNK